MRVLVENSCHAMHNWGDIAMLDVAIRRVRGIHPSAQLDVLTTEQQSVLRRWPEVNAVPTRSRMMLAHSIVERLGMIVPAVKRLVSDGKLAGGIVGRKVHRSLRASDMVVLSGGGYLTDVFPGGLEATITLIERANELGKPTVLFGQGIGPLNDASSRSRLAQALRGVHAIGLRESRYSPSELRSMGISSDRYKVTGDDALSLLPSRRLTPAESEDNQVGINLRTAAYAGFSPEMIRRLRSALRRIDADRLGIHWRPVPISFSKRAPDSRAIMALGLPLGDSASHRDSLNMSTLLDQIRRCRVVITASYHAAVFALGSGVPTVAFYASPYYRRKFAGLQDLFGPGLAIVDLTLEGAREALTESFHRLWGEAPELRSKLIASADAQIAAAEEFYTSTLAR
jgi:polysaccharide pyruvyl transferase WcaK-like protein